MSGGEWRGFLWNRGLSERQGWNGHDGQYGRAFLPGLRWLQFLGFGVCDFEISWRYLGIKQAGVGSGFEPVGGGISRNKMGWDWDEPCGHIEGVGLMDGLDGVLRDGGDLRTRFFKGVWVEAEQTDAFGVGRLG